MDGARIERVYKARDLKMTYRCEPWFRLSKSWALPIHRPIIIH